MSNEKPHSPDIDYEAVFQSQKAFFNSHQTKDISFRKAMLKRLKDVIRKNEDAMYSAIHKDFSKSAFETFSTELSIIYKEIDYFLKNISKLSKPQKVRGNLVNLPSKSYICQDPLGCTLIIGAWNYPYQLSLVPAVSAIAAGNTCFIKPSELPENTMRIMAKLINDNFPSHYLYVVQGGIAETSEILKYPFDKIFFTGSPKVGKIVYEAAAKNLVPVTLELGGKSPAIITKTADIKVAARRIVWGKFLNAGQTCIAPDYLLVDARVKDELLACMKDRLDAAAYEEGVSHYVNIINRKNYERIKSLIEPAKVFYGGRMNDETLYIQPTILDRVEQDDPVMQEEIFGPVLPVLTFHDFDAALAQVNSSAKPLSAYLFTGDNTEKDKFLKHISFGGGCINDTIMHITNERLPFGGIGNSGTGHYHGTFGFACFSHQKSIIEKKNWGEPDLKYPPYSEAKEKWLKRFLS